MTRIHERLIHVIGALLIVSGLTLWLVSTFRENILFFVTPSDFFAMLPNHPAKLGKRFRLGGLVAAGSIKKNGIEITFIVTDEKGAKTTVNYRGIAPELFRENQGVIAEGILKNDIFEAERLLAKHDERYIPKDVAQRLKQKKLWKEK